MTWTANSSIALQRPSAHGSRQESWPEFLQTLVFKLHIEADCDTSAQVELRCDWTSFGSWHDKMQQEWILQKGWVSCKHHKSTLDWAQIAFSCCLRCYKSLQCRIQSDFEWDMWVRWNQGYLTTQRCPAWLCLSQAWYSHTTYNDSREFCDQNRSRGFITCRGWSKGSRIALLIPS